MAATAILRREHAQGAAGFTARTRAVLSKTAGSDAYLNVLDRCLADGVLADEDLAVLVSTADTWGLSAERLDVLHRNYVDALPPKIRAENVDTIRTRLDLIKPSHRSWSGHSLQVDAT